MNDVNPEPRVLVFDIEVSDMKADYGSLLMVGYKWLGNKKIHCPSLLDYEKEWALDDKALVTEVHRVISQADMLIGFYSSMHDIKYLQSKFLKYGLPVLPPVPHIDLYFLARTHLSLSRKSLDNLSRYLDTKHKKYYCDASVWQRAKVGDLVGMKEIIKHCRADIAVTEEMYYKLRSLSRQPSVRIGGWLPCRVCGSTRLQRRGYSLTATQGKKIRVQCQECSHWETRSPEHAEVAA